MVVSQVDCKNTIPFFIFMIVCSVNLCIKQKMSTQQVQFIFNRQFLFQTITHLLNTFPLHHSSYRFIQKHMNTNPCNQSLFLIYIYQKITMTTQRVKKLKSLKSLQTVCTLDDSRQKSIKINILRPLNPMSSVKIGQSTQQATHQQQLQLNKVTSGQNLINIPELSKKQLQIQFLQSSNNSDPQQSQRIRGSNKSNKKSYQFFDESIDFKEFIMPNGSVNVISNKKTAGLGKKQQDNISADERLSNIIRMSHNKDNNNDSNVQIQINLDQSQQISQEVEQENKEKLKLVKKQIDFKQVAPRLKLSSKYEAIQPFRSEQYLKENRSNSRIKLRDYLYMVQASSKRVQSKRNQARGNRNIPQAQSPPPSLLSARSEEKVSLKSGKTIETKDQNSFKNRKESIISKYSVSNKHMFGILKEQICSQIKIAESNLQKVTAQLEDVEASAEPTNQELLILYNLRRQMKEYINKKIENTIELIRKEKRSNILKSSRNADEDQILNSKQVNPLKNKN